MNDAVWVKNSTTGGHLAFKTARAKTAFTNNMKECKLVKLLPSDIVADIGAYVGEYSMYASRMGVKKVISYEPTPATYAVLERNATDTMTCRNMAVVGDDTASVQLHISKGVGVTNSIEKTKGKTGAITVPAMRYERAVDGVSVVKIDVEGAEYSFNIVQPQLRAIILEFHPIVGRDWKADAWRIMADIEDHGFTPLCTPTFVSGWNCAGCWERNI